jgi:CRISPR-associated protein Cmr5
MAEIQNNENKRAEKAWECIQNVNHNPDMKFKTEYRSIVMKCPTLIITNGLGQTLAFLKSKGKNNIKNSEEKLYRDIDEWLTPKMGLKPDEELIKKVISLPSEQYRHATIETLSFLIWLKRFADAVLPKEGD